MDFPSISPGRNQSWLERGCGNCYDGRPACRGGQRTEELMISSMPGHHGIVSSKVLCGISTVGCTFPCPRFLVDPSDFYHSIWCFFYTSQTLSGMMGSTPSLSHIITESKYQNSFVFLSKITVGTRAQRRSAYVAIWLIPFCQR